MCHDVDPTRVRQTGVTTAMREMCGFTLIEVLIALFIILVGVLAAAPMFLFAVRGNATGADLGSVAAVAVERMEQFRREDYGNLVAGGDLDNDVKDYFDNTDPDYTIRWLIQDNATPTETRTVSVRVMATRVMDGPRREITVSTVRGR